MLNDKYDLSLLDNVFFAKRNIVDTIYKESRLEGIAITFPETNEIYEGRVVAGLSVDDVVKVNNLKHAWEFVFETIDYPIDLRYIKQLNHIIGGANIVPLSGDLRTSDMPNSDSINEDLDSILNSDTTVTDKAITLMLYLMRSKMFYDGNKRVAQIVANQYMIQHGKGIISIPIEKQKDFFELLIDYYETNDIQEIKQFVYDNAVSGLTLNKSVDKTFYDDFKIKPKNKEVIADDELVDTISKRLMEENRVAYEELAK